MKRAKNGWEEVSQWSEELRSLKRRLEEARRIERSVWLKARTHSEMSSEALSKMLNLCTESQVGQGSNHPQLRSAQRKSKPESSVKQGFGHTQLA